MDGNQGSLPPNLADILSTLSKFAPPATDNVLGPHERHPKVDGANVSSYNASGATSTRPISSQGTVVDPASITEWSAGLRCVSKIATQNPHFASAIRNMVANQRKNEMDWYSKRQELKREQAQKGSSMTELNSIMKSIGAIASQQTHQPRSEQELKSELDDFDSKIHRAQTQMVIAMTAELKAIGVPFFGTNADLILPGINEMGDNGTTNGITNTELRALQHRMIIYLEDMYKD
ncbi:Hypothetical protein D9617_10g072320 [Elsinoe fawcettii]|nr:Hypothetical protein D9617_10g072320 [Elsinoe fawcettii]